MTEPVEYTPCGGCGAKEPKERCLGCFHVFSNEEWPARYFHEQRLVEAIDALPTATRSPSVADKGEQA